MASDQMLIPFHTEHRNCCHYIYAIMGCRECLAKRCGGFDLIDRRLLKEKQDVWQKHKDKLLEWRYTFGDSSTVTAGYMRRNGNVIPDALHTIISRYCVVLGKKKSQRMLLSTLQDVLPLRIKWKPVAMNQLREKQKMRKNHFKILLRVHPDKISHYSIEDQVVCSYIYESVRHRY